ncbi:MAG: Lcl C-terminal domain-containing protein [Wenzhouxiangella sp.]
MNTQLTWSMRVGIRLASLALAVSLTGPARAECQGGENAAILPATPSEAFFDFGNGTVLHRPTQLIWMRCALGQEWNGTGCSGEPALMDWAQALNAAAEADLAGHTDWRLPNRNELGAIVETRCHGPAINGAIFPDSSAQSVWTSSPAAAAMAWQVAFDEGAVVLRPNSEAAAVRLVRGGRL